MWADRGHLMAGAKFRLQEIARHSPQPVPHTVPLSQLPGHLQHRRPVHRAHDHTRGQMRERDSPHSRSGADIQHTDGRYRAGNAQMFAQNLRRLVTQRKEALDELGKELLPFCLLVGRHVRPAEPTASFSRNHCGRICRMTCRKKPP